MDKNKNRTDLLAAGRKKLQQFRQKKDGKGSSSHGKSSKKSSKSEQLESDADAAASTARSTGSLQAIEEETLSRVDSSSGGANTLENPVSSGVDILATDASSDPVEPGGNVDGPTDDPDRVTHEVVFDRNVISSSDTNEAEGAKVDDDVTISASLGDSEIPYSQRETKHDDSYVRVEVPTSDVAVDIEQSSASIDMEILSKDAKEPFSSHDDTPNISLVDMRGDQVTDEADSLGLEQSKRSYDVEAQDQQLNLPQHSSSQDTIEWETSEQTIVEDAASQLERTDRAFATSTGAHNASDVSLTSSLDLSKVEQTHDVHEMTNQWGGVVDANPPEAFKESKEQFVPEVSGLDYSGNDEEDDDKVDRIDAKQSNEQYMPEDSFIFVGKSAESANSSEGSPHVVGAISLTQLIEVIKGLGEDEFRSLVSSRTSVSKENVGTDDKILWEKLKEELYISNCEKNIFQLQLADQSGLQMDCDHKFGQLNDEIFVLQASLKQAHEKGDRLSVVLSECQSKLQVSVSEREEFQRQALAAKAKVEEVSVRADELQNSLEVSQSHFLSLSKESADFKELVAALQLENETLKAILGSQSEERDRLSEERDSFLHENEKLLKEIADCNNSMAALQEKYSYLSETLASVNDERKKFEEEKESHAYENEKLLADLSDTKSRVDALQAENLTLSQSLTLATEEKKKLEEANECFVSENEKLLLELPALHERLSKEQEKCMRLEVELKEVTMRLDELTEKNKLLNHCLDMHKASHEGTSDKQDEKLLSVGDNVHHAGTTDVERRYSENQEGEATFSSLEKSLSAGIAGGMVIQLPDQFVFDDSLGLVHLKRHLDDAANTLQKLENAIEGMHTHSVAMSRSGGKASAPAVSKLIQAFESKVHYDEQEAEEGVSTEDASPSADAFVVTKDHTGKLKAIISQLVADVGNADLAFKAERDGRSAVDLTVKQLKGQLEALQEHSDSSQARSIEVEVLYEVAKHHLSSVCKNNNELELLCDTLKQQDIRLIAENSELGERLDQWRSRNNDLESQLNDLQLSKDILASTLHDQFENFRKESAEKALAVEVERNSASAQIVEAFGKLDTGILLSSTNLTGDHSFRDICNHVAASVDAAVKMINDLKDKVEATLADRGATSTLLSEVTEKNNKLEEKLEATLADYETTSGLLSEANEKCDESLRKIELANGTLLKLYYALRKLVLDSCGSLEESDINIQTDELLDAVDYSFYGTFVEKLDTFLSERLQLLSLNNKLNMELMRAAEDIEELNKRSRDLTSIQKLIDYIQNVLKLEDAPMGLDGMPVSRLESLVSLLAEKYKEAEKLVGLSREELGSKETELAELQEKLRQLEALKIQQENENPLKESQAEDDLTVLQSQLQEKINELGQSEQRLSSIREKLSIAVAKGKGLIVQRDTLKQSLAETSSELERYSQELQLKDARLQELEEKLKTYSEAGERVEALESELSYIRNSATALRESFLLKDSVLQRIEEILEDLELPEHFHSRGIIEKVEWLARSVTGNSVPPTDWDMKSSVGGSYSDAGFVVMDAWKEDAANPNSGDDLRRNFEELQNKFYGLAEQNEMLEQSLMERNQLVQKWEELLDRINMPSHLRTLEPEDRIGWLGSALSEANEVKYSLLQKIDELENYCGSLATELEGSQKRISELNAEVEVSQEKISGLEEELQAVMHAREAISESLETLTSNHEELSARVVQSELDKENLKNEVAGLQEKLVEKLRSDEQLRIIDGEISKLQDIICDALMDPERKNLIYGGNNIECLEQLLRMLIENATVPIVKHGPEDAVKEQHPVGAETIPIEEKTSDTLGSSEAEVVLIKREIVDGGEPNVEYMKKQLEDTLSELMTVREERDQYMEAHQSLAVEMESLHKHRAELQELLKQEEQKFTSAREKLNVAVRKGKSLVQQRDSLKQTIEETTSELVRLKSETKRQEDVLVDYEQKMKDLIAYSERVEVLQSECEYLRNRLAETDRSWEQKGHALSMILGTLQGIDVGGEFYSSDPIEKLEFIVKQWRDLQMSTSSLEQESRKSRKAAELLLAELNEVQERNDSFQEELAKLNFELAELSKERELAESARLEAVSRLEEQSIIQSEQKKKQYSELMVLKSTADVLQESFLSISKLVNGIFTEDFEFMQNLVGVIELYLRTGATQVVLVPTFNGTEGVGFFHSEKKGNFLSSFFSSESHAPDHIEDKFISEVSSSLQEITKQVGAFKVTLQENSVHLHEQASNISKLMGDLYLEITSQNESSETMRRKIKELESIIEEKESETIVLRRNFTLLHEACTSSLVAIQNSKGRVVKNTSPDDSHGPNFKSARSTDVGFSSGMETNLFSEEATKSMAERLLLDVKIFSVLKDEIIEDDKKEMKITISNLQKELHEKDIQRERISMELVAQIKEAEASVARYTSELQSSQARVHDLEKQAEIAIEERNFMEQSLKKLQDEQVMLTELEERISSLTGTLAAKDQEIEALMQALDEEEVQMEELTHKAQEIEKVIDQKNSEIANLETSRGKVLKKLSTTVNKFDELHQFSESLLSEVEKLQSQLQDRDAEISFLRQEVTRCTNDALVASQNSSKSNTEAIHDLLAWLDTLVSPTEMQDVNLDDNNQIHDYKEILQKKIAFVLSELENLRGVAQSKDAMLQVERSKIEELTRREEALQRSLHEMESQPNMHADVGESEILEVEPVINKWVAPVPSSTSQVRNLRKVNNDQVAIAVDMDEAGSSRLEDEDDDKVHGFKSLTASKVVPKFTRPVTDVVDGLWVSCDRTLMRRPTLRLGIMIYWALLHTLLAAFVF